MHPPLLRPQNRLLPRISWRALLRIQGLILVVAALFAQTTISTVAATTGALSGTVVDQSNRPVADASVTVASPSQTVTSTTDARGAFSFLALAPDTYTVSVRKQGFGVTTQSGFTVTADASTTASFQLLATIGSTTARAQTLVRPGQAQDVYTVSGTLAQTTQQLGGGGTIGQTYSQLSSLPGIYVPQGVTTGQNTAGPYVRGGDYNQVGYEFDGIPVNRSFDNYVTNTQGVTGQQELQAYTGGVDPTSTGQGLSGYINQTIKRGTFPGTGQLEFIGGAPSPYSSGRFEYGRQNEARTFSFYVAQTNWGQKYRYGDQYNGGTGVSAGSMLVPGPIGGVGLTGDGVISRGPYFLGQTAELQTSETVGNFIFGIPQKNGNRDEIQLLYQTGRQKQFFFDSLNDFGVSLGDLGLTPNGTAYFNSKVNNGAVNARFDPSLSSTYFFPSQPNGQANVDPNQRTSYDNANGIVKLQYQKNFSKGYARVYGYTNFSDWLIYSPNTYQYNFQGSNADYELTTHSAGAAAQFGLQLSSRHTMTSNISYVTANVIRANNGTPASAGYRIQIRDDNGACYSPVTGAQANCYSSATAYAGAATRLNPTATPALPNGLPANAYWRLELPGYSTTLNTVKPQFTTYSLQDAISVGDKLRLNVGARFDNFKYILGDTSQEYQIGGSLTPLFTEYNLEHCYNPVTNSLSPAVATAASGFACPAGLAHTNISNTYPGQVSSFVFEPRLSGTYTLNADTVLRFSAGKFATPINSAYVQYNRFGGTNGSGADLPAWTANTFLQYGFNTPRHDAGPEISYNYDFSVERRFGSRVPLSLSVTPFWRHTENQTQSFFLDPKTLFVSGLNVGSLYAYGFEAFTRVGDFNRNGMAAQLAFTFTHNKIKYSNFAGSNRSVIDNINDYITGNPTSGVVGFNQLTQAGGGSPCYAAAANAAAGIAAGQGGACGANFTNVNPYYNMPVQPTFDRYGAYSPFDVIPTAGAAAGAYYNFANATNSYEIPFVTTLVLQYRANRFRFSPSLQIDSGRKYGSPFTWVGYDPSSGCNSTTTANACGPTYLPNPYTGKFDTLGQFYAPTTASISAQASYDIGPRITATVIGTNLFHHCYSHGYPWEQGGSNVCAYGNNTNYVGNATNAGVAYPGYQLNPFGYLPDATATLPTNVYFSLSLKL